MTDICQLETVQVVNLKRA